jgi:hypothetical protein
MTLPSVEGNFSYRWKSIKIRFVQAIPHSERGCPALLQLNCKRRMRHLTSVCPSVAMRPNRLPTDLWQHCFCEHFICDEAGMLSIDWVGDDEEESSEFWKIINKV